MTDVQLTAGDLDLLRAIVARRQPSLIDVIERINTGEITEYQQTQLVDVLSDELWEHGMDSDGVTAIGEPVRYLMDGVQIVPYYARLHESADVVLLAPIPRDQIIAADLPPSEGLIPGDEGTIVDAYHAPNVYTVEFFRNGGSVGIADVTPAQIRVVAPASPSVAAHSTDN